jgi:hypothetical protein
MAGDAPQPATAWGWVGRPYVDDRGDDGIEYVRPLGGTFLGHIDSEWLYLIPETTMQFVTSAAQAGDQHFPVEQRTLLRRLDEMGLIATQDGRRVVNQRILGTTRRVIKLKRSALSLLLQEREQREHREHAAAPDSTVPGQRSQNTAADGKNGNGLREQPDSEPEPVPAVPGVPAVRGIGEEEEREIVIL